MSGGGRADAVDRERRVDHYNGPTYPPDWAVLHLVCPIHRTTGLAASGRVQNGRRLMLPRKRPPHLLLPSSSFLETRTLSKASADGFLLLPVLHRRSSPRSGPASQAGAAAAAVLHHRVGRARRAVDLEAAVQGARHGGEESRGG
jgi:hypothetical protein